jgi:hypothetical protein
MVHLTDIYKGHLKSMWTGSTAPVMQKKVVTVMPSCSGGGNIVVA